MSRERMENPFILAHFTCMSHCWYSWKVQAFTIVYADYVAIMIIAVEDEKRNYMLPN